MLTKDSSLSQPVLYQRRTVNRDLDEATQTMCIFSELTENAFPLPKSDVEDMFASFQIACSSVSNLTLL